MTMISRLVCTAMPGPTVSEYQTNIETLGIYRPSDEFQAQNGDCNAISATDKLMVNDELDFGSKWLSSGQRLVRYKTTWKVRSG